MRTLEQAFEAAWVRQPEAQAQDARLAAAQARRRIADSWTAEPPSVEVSTETDRFSGNDGAREYAAGVALPLWLPGERRGAQALADAELSVLQARRHALRLRLAATVRDSFWDWRSSIAERAVAQVRLANARRLAADVARRLKAGDAARSDLQLAEGAVAAAEAGLADTEGAAVQTSQQLRALVGPVRIEVNADPLPEPDPGADELAGARHPALDELGLRAEVARSARRLAGVRTRGNPEITLGAIRERDGVGARYGTAVVLGVRVPFGSDARHEARVAEAAADEIEAETQLRVERERIESEAGAARARVGLARTRLEAARRRASLAEQSRTAFRKSFRAGETDLPTLLRVELDANEAELQASRAQMNMAQAVSQLRQALGLLPE